MIMYGTHLMSTTEEMQLLDVQKICEMIRQPNEKMLADIARLRTIRTVAPQKYTLLKKELPFFVCGIFSPRFRRSENFAYIDTFVVDLDHLVEKDIRILDLLENLKKDERIHLCFLSPSGNGIKVVFRLKERCYDAGIFTMFYRKFVHQFALQYHIEQVVDTKTCDVTRACFLSYDPMAYYQATSVPVNIKDYIENDDIDNIFSTDNTIQKENQKNAKCYIETTDIHFTEPEQDTLDKIKLILKKQKLQVPQKKEVLHVPDILNELIADIQLMLEKTGIKVIDIRDIQYGKKIQAKLGLKTCEINLFYGKKGFSVVQSPKRGCSSELNEVVAELLKCFFQNLFG